MTASDKEVGLRTDCCVLKGALFWNAHHNNNNNNNSREKKKTLRKSVVWRWSHYEHWYSCLHWYEDFSIRTEKLAPNPSEDTRSVIPPHNGAPPRLFIRSSLRAQIRRRFIECLLFLHFSRKKRRRGVSCRSLSLGSLASYPDRSSLLFATFNRLARHSSRSLPKDVKTRWSQERVRVSVVLDAPDMLALVLAMERFGKFQWRFGLHQFVIAMFDLQLWWWCYWWPSGGGAERRMSNITDSRGLLTKWMKNML